MSTGTQQWRVGDATITSVVEDEIAHIPPEFFFPAATAAEVARRRAEIAADPAGWVAQEVVSLSSLPCLDGGRLEPRRVDLRAFVYLTGPKRENCRLAPLGLTRVAQPGSLIVNSSRGGGAKDTWIVPPTDGDPDVRTGR